jgi:hypothetical protein
MTTSARDFLSRNLLTSRDRALRRYAPHLFVVHVKLNFGVSKGFGHPMIYKIKLFGLR